MLRLLAVSTFLLAASAASAETLTGTIDDPSLRRKIDLVYVESAPGQYPPPATGALMNQRGNTYLPHLLPILAGTKVTFQSEDPELHNVYARGTKKVLFNNAVLPHMKFERVFSEPGVVHLTCNVHKEMSAYVVILQNPYWTKSDRSGKFTIANLPPGTYTVRIWGEQLTDEQNARKFTFTVGQPGHLNIASR
jgi:plastocyanin